MQNCGIRHCIECGVDTKLNEKYNIPDFDVDGKPVDKGYLECNLPDFLKTSLSVYKAALEKEQNGEKVSLMDCYYCELQSDINSAEVNDIISAEQAWFLREKYLGLSKQMIDFFDITENE